MFARANARKRSSNKTSELLVRLRPKLKRDAMRHAAERPPGSEDLGGGVDPFLLVAQNHISKEARRILYCGSFFEVLAAAKLLSHCSHENRKTHCQKCCGSQKAPRRKQGRVAGSKHMLPAQTVPRGFQRAGSNGGATGTHYTTESSHTCGTADKHKIITGLTNASAGKHMALRARNNCRNESFHARHLQFQGAGQQK